MTLDWQPNEQYTVFYKEADVGILFMVERLVGKKLYAAVAVEGAHPRGISLAQFIETAEKFLLGDKFRSVASAQAACAKYLRAAQREIARRRRAGAVDVLDINATGRVVHLPRWSWEMTSDVPRA
jgi:hypothetical protein